MIRLIDACWSLFKAGIAIAVVAAAAIGVYMYVRMDEEIRRHVETLLAEKFPQLNVSVGGARLMEGKGIAIYTVRVSDPRSTGGDDRLLAVDEIRLVCNSRLTELAQGALDVRQVLIKGPTVWVRRTASGRWNYEPFLPLEPCGMALPQVTVSGGAITISDETLPEAPPIELRDIAVSMEPVAQATVPGTWPSLAIEGSLACPQCKRVDVQATVDGQERRTSVRAKIDRLQIDGSLSAWAAPWLPPEAALTTVAGLVSGTAACDWRCDSAAPPQFAANLQLWEGRVDDPRLPRSATELAGRIVADGRQLRVEQLRGKCGSATVALSLNRTGWDAGAQVALAATVRDTQLDAELYRSVPPLLRQQWDRYKPEGVVDASLEARFDGQRWTPNASLSGRQLAFESDKFPYRVTGGSGSLKFTGATNGAAAQLDLDLIGIAGGQPVHIVGHVIDPRPGAAGVVEITGEGLTIEDRMIAALEPKPQEVITSLKPKGKFNVFVRVERTVPGEPPVSTLRLDLTNVEINYQHFPYELSGIRGVIESTNNHWTFRDLVSGGRRVIHGEGSLTPVAEGTELYLRFTGERVSLDDALFDALPESVQAAWNKLQPRGQVALEANVHHRTGQGNPNIIATISPRPESAQVRPEFFPYLLEQVRGRVTYNDGEVTLADVRAVHDRTVISTNGRGHFLPDGQWAMKLSGLTADQVTARADLVSALPRPLAKVIERLQPTGSFSIHDAVLDFRQSASEIAQVEARWDLVLDCTRTDLNCGVQLQNIHGSVRLMGEADGRRTSTAGTLDLETLTLRDVQFTNVEGPLFVDEGQCRLGRWIAQPEGGTAQPITAVVYGGNVAADVRVTFDARPKYGARAQIRGADLHRLVVERFGSQKDFRGLIDADFSLGGEGYNLPNLLGQGEVHVRQANFYELPLLASLVKMLKTGSSDATAFDQCDIRFQMQGQHVNLDTINFLGEVVNLYGKGYTNIDDQEVKMVFEGVVGRRDYQIPVVRQIVKQVDGFAMQLNVAGTLSEPQVTTEALPAVKQMLQMGTDLVTPTTDQPRQADRSRGFLGLPTRQ